jgi:serine protease Do
MITLRRRSRLLAMGGLTVLAIAATALIALSATPAKGVEKSEPFSTAQALSGIPVQGVEKTESLSMAQALSNTFAQIADKASPAVVFIEVEKELKGSPAGFYGPGGGPMDPRGFFRYFFGPGMGEPGMPEPMTPNQGPVPMGQGSGFIISPDGYIVTNHHVVGDADRVKVALADGRTFDAKLIGSDPETEIALIKVDAKDLATLTLGNSDNLRVGEWVLAIGSPFGLSHSVTSGIVSARGRGNVGIVDYADFIQTDAAINPGNSGGPLLNMNGEVIGMNTAIVSRTGGSNGVGFAIPVNMVKYIVDQLREHGAITRGFLGISIQSLTPDLAKWFGINEGHGVLIADVSKGSPADQAGLQRDDVIVAFNGQPVEEIGAFRSHVSTTAQGTKIDLTIIRDGKRLTKTIVIGSLPAEKVATMNVTPESAPTDLGFTVQGLTDDLAKRLGYEGQAGVVVAQVAPGSQAARAGIRPGALIQEVNKREVHNPREFQDALKHDARDRTALLLMREGQATRYVALDIA